MLIQEDVHHKVRVHRHLLVLHLDWLERMLLFQDQEVHQEDVHLKDRVHHQEDVQLKVLVHLLVLHLERTLLLGELYSKVRFHKDVLPEIIQEININ